MTLSFTKVGDTPISQFLEYVIYFKDIISMTSDIRLSKWKREEFQLAIKWARYFEMAIISLDSQQKHDLNLYFIADQEKYPNIDCYILEHSLYFLYKNIFQNIYLKVDIIYDLLENYFKFPNVCPFPNNILPNSQQIQESKNEKSKINKKLIIDQYSSFSFCLRDIINQRSTLNLFLTLYEGLTKISSSNSSIYALPSHLSSSSSSSTQFINQSLSTLILQKLQKSLPNTIEYNKHLKVIKEYGMQSIECLESIAYCILLLNNKEIDIDIESQSKNNQILHSLVELLLLFSQNNQSTLTSLPSPLLFHLNPTLLCQLSDCCYPIFQQYIQHLLHSLSTSFSLSTSPDATNRIQAETISFDIHYRLYLLIHFSSRLYNICSIILSSYHASIINHSSLSISTIKRIDTLMNNLKYNISV